MASFFRAERVESGWRFLVLWLLATIFGFGLGLMLEWALFQRLVLWIAVPLGSVWQAWILNRHVSIFLPWLLVTSLGWWVGGGIVAVIFNFIMPDTGILIHLGLISLVGGALGGLLQWLILRYWLPRVGIWWLVIGALSWQIPGLISGLALMLALQDNKLSMEDRRFEPSGQF